MGTDGVGGGQYSGVTDAAAGGGCETANECNDGERWVSVDGRVMYYETANGRGVT